MHPIHPEANRREGKAGNIPEAVEAAEVVCDGGVEGEVRQREQARGRPEVAALEAGGRGGGDGGEDDGEDEEEGEEEAPELLLLRVGAPLLVDRLVEVELDDGAQRLRRRVPGHHVHAAAVGADVGGGGRRERVGRRPRHPRHQPVVLPLPIHLEERPPAQIL